MINLKDKVVVVTQKTCHSGRRCQCSTFFSLKPFRLCYRRLPHCGWRYGHAL